MSTLVSGDRDTLTHKWAQTRAPCKDQLSLMPCVPPRPLGAHSPVSAPTHHGEGHPVDLVLVLRLVLPERAVPVARRERGLSSAQLCPAVPS